MFVHFSQKEFLCTLSAALLMKFIVIAFDFLIKCGHTMKPNIASYVTPNKDKNFKNRNNSK